MRQRIAYTRTSSGDTSGRRNLATPAEISEYLGVPVATLTAWRYRGQGPRYVKVGRHIRYDWRDIERWQSQQTKETTS